MLCTRRAPGSIRLYAWEILQTRAESKLRVPPSFPPSLFSRLIPTSNVHDIPKVAS